MKNISKTTKIIGLTLSVLVIGVGSIKPIWSKVSPLTYIGQAMKNTVKTLGKESQESKEAMGMDLLSERESFEQSLDFKVKGMIGENTSYMDEYLNNSSASIKGAYSGEQNLIELSFKAPDGMGLSGAVFIDPEQIGFKVNDITNDFLMINLKSMARKFNDSALKDFLYADDLPEGLDLSLEEGNNLLIEEETKEELEAYYKDVLKSLEVTYEGKEERYGKKVKTFKLCLPEDELKDLLVESFEIITNDKKIQDYIYVSEMDYYYDKNEFLEDVKEAQKDFKEGLKQIDVEDGMIVEVGIDSKQRIVHFAGEIEGENEYTKLKSELEINLLGKKKLSNEIEAELVLSNNWGKAKGDFSYTSNIGEKSDVLSQSMAVKFGESGMAPIRFTYDTEYSPKAKEDNYHLEMKLDIEDEGSFAVEGQGTLQVDKKSKTFNLQLDDFSATAGTFSGPVGIKGSLDYTYEVVPSTDLTPSKKKDLFELSSDELESLSWNIVQNTSRLFGDY